MQRASVWVCLLGVAACAVDERTLSVTVSPAQPERGAPGDAGAPPSAGADVFAEDEPLLPGRVLTVDLDAIDFSECVAGQTITRPLRVRNAGDTALEGLGVMVRGEGSVFSVVSTTCTDALEPGATCQADVAFAPELEGPASDDEDSCAHLAVLCR